MTTGHERGTKESSLQGAVCVIDGDPGIRNSLLMLLGTLGVRVVTFETAEDLLTCLDGQRPLFLITELNLPGMGGFQLKAALDDRGIRIPTLGLTEDADEGMRRHAATLGFVDLVEKPFVFRSVIQRIQETLGVPG